MSGPEQVEDAPLTPEEQDRYDRQGAYLEWERRRREQAEGSQ